MICLPSEGTQMSFFCETNIQKENKKKGKQKGCIKIHPSESYLVYLVKAHLVQNTARISPSAFHICIILFVPFALAKLLKLC